ncbi:hypothetical protein CALCODRAFT_513532 [Calocera cornea HHB12733]|uniref:Uncharacterized protein n=1 Tax=Calocera cornea HHB12733 TaxID=1353952 RepID=A0A165C0C1_9BASI|nr:hypothetical protein CALCODRAFT_513532 [Calocera cornea HHB12733]
MAPAEVVSVDELRQEATLRWCNCIKWGSLQEPEIMTFNASFSDCGRAMDRLISNKQKLAKIKWPVTWLSVDPNGVLALPLVQQLRMWAPVAAQILCGLVPHPLMDERMLLEGGLGRTRSSKAESEAEWVQLRQTEIYPHELDAVVDWLSHDVMPECSKLLPDISSDYLRDLSTGPGLVLGGMAVAVCLMEDKRETFDLLSMYRQRGRLRRRPPPEPMRAWEAMNKAYIPIGAAQECKFIETHRINMDDWHIVVEGFELVANSENSGTRLQGKQMSFAEVRKTSKDDTPQSEYSGHGPEDKDRIENEDADLAEKVDNGADNANNVWLTKGLEEMPSICIVMYCGTENQDLLLACLVPNHRVVTIPRSLCMHCNPTSICDDCCEIGARPELWPIDFRRNIQEGGATSESRSLALPPAAVLTAKAELSYVDRSD